jgi:hypothetical protein
MTRTVPSRRPAWRLACAVVLLAYTPGCVSLYGSRPVAVLVRDIETKKPIPRAEVHVSYPLADSPLAPPQGSGPTGDDGVARLTVAPNGDDGVVLNVTAAGYIPVEQTVPAATVRAYEPAHLFEAVERRPVDLAIELYAEPRPVIEMVLPVGYKGVVKAEVHVQDGAPCAPGQRLFSGAMLPSGVVPVAGPPLLREANINDMRARFADGTPVSRSPKSGEFGLWLLSWEGTDRYTFYVGTQADYESYCLFSHTASVEGKRSSGGKGGGGRGRGSRRGGQSSSGPDGGGTSP